MRGHFFSHEVTKVARIMPATLWFTGKCGTRHFAAPTHLAYPLGAVYQISVCTRYGISSGLRPASGFTGLTSPPEKFADCASRDGTSRNVGKERRPRTGPRPADRSVLAPQILAEDRRTSESGCVLTTRKKAVILLEGEAGHVR